MTTSNVRLDKIPVDQTKLRCFWRSHGGGIVSIAAHLLILLLILGGAWHTMPPSSSSVWVELRPAGVSLGASSPSNAPSSSFQSAQGQLSILPQKLDSLPKYPKYIEHSAKPAKIISKRALAESVVLPASRETKSPLAIDSSVGVSAAGATQLEKSGSASTRSGSTDKVGDEQGVIGEGYSAASYRAQGLHNPAPVYPALSRERGETGRVILLVDVSEQGVPHKVEIEHSSGFTRLDRAAQETVMRWRFLPAKRNGITIVDQIRVPIRFREVE